MNVFMNAVFSRAHKHLQWWILHHRSAHEEDNAVNPIIHAVLWGRGPQRQTGCHPPNLICFLGYSQKRGITYKWPIPRGHTHHWWIRCLIYSNLAVDCCCSVLASPLQLPHLPTRTQQALQMNFLKEARLPRVWSRNKNPTMEHNPYSMGCIAIGVATRLLAISTEYLFLSIQKEMPITIVQCKVTIFILHVLVDLQQRQFVDMFVFWRSSCMKR